MKYLILGAGPAGLTAANFLMDCGENSFLVLEKEKMAGGLCRSENVGGFPIDTGGGALFGCSCIRSTKVYFSFYAKRRME